MSSKYIVTGGAGFIGSNIVAELNRRGENDILIVDEATDGSVKAANLDGLKFNDMQGKGDFRIAIRKDRAAKSDCVIHMGACSSTTESDAAYLEDNNYRYTRELCEWCLRHGVRFIYASSAATYGDGSLGYSDADDQVHSLQPLNLYGLSKQRFDIWALENGWLSDIVGLKYFNVYGPRENHKGDMRSVVHKAYGQINETGCVKLFKSYVPEYGDGEQVRDFIYVKDAVDVTLWFNEHRDVSGLYNCGTGTERNWNDLARSTFSAMNREPNIEYIEMPEKLRKKYQYRTCADTDKLRAAGYDKPFTSLEEGVRDYVQGYLSDHYATA